MDPLTESPEVTASWFAPRRLRAAEKAALAEALAAEGRAGAEAVWQAIVDEAADPTPDLSVPDVAGRDLVRVCHCALAGTGRCCDAGKTTRFAGGRL